METNEALKRALWRETEAELVKLVEGREEVGEGDLKELEQQVMERILNRGEQGEGAARRREGRCGHQQRLGGERPKGLLTLLGKGKFRRPSYQCLLGESSPPQPQGEGEREAVRCSHGEAPADALWGVQERGTTAGVQAAVSYVCAALTLEEAVERLTRLLPPSDIGTPGAQPDAPGWGGAGHPGGGSGPSQDTAGAGRGTGGGTRRASSRSSSLRAARKYLLTPGGIRNALAHMRQLPLRRTYHTQSAEKGQSCVIEGLY